MTLDLASAWEQLHDATPPGWQVGRPSYNPGRHAWEMYAFDPAEKPKVGLRSREWQAVAQDELGVVAEMARCLREIKEGREPK